LISSVGQRLNDAIRKKELEFFFFFPPFKICLRAIPPTWAAAPETLRLICVTVMTFRSGPDCELTALKTKRGPTGTLITEIVC